VPKFLFCDNGSEFTSQAMDLWAYQNGMKIDFSRPGKPTDNAFVESFNGTFRAECLNATGSGRWPKQNWSARPLLYQLRSDKTGIRGAMYDARQEAYSGADREPAAAG
jgi:transposase InsO family protein